MRHSTHPQVHWAVDTRTSVPAGVGHFGIVGDYHQLIFRADLQLAGQINKKVGVAIVPTTHLFSVQQNSGIHVNSLKFKDYCLFGPIHFAKKRAGVNIFSTGEKRPAIASGSIGRALFNDHRVVRDTHGDCCCFPFPIKKPAVIQSCFLQSSSPFPDLILSLVAVLFSLLL